MTAISLLCTVHEERGKTTSAALYRTLEELKPEVIFLEVPPDRFAEYYIDKVSCNLESAAIALYAEKHAVRLVPVDMPTPDSEFFLNSDRMLEEIAGASSNFRRLRLWFTNYLADYGLPYLNSEHCNKIWSEIYEEMKDTVSRLGSKRLSDLFYAWNNINHLRENYILDEVYACFLSEPFDNGVLVIGAAHRKAIMEKTKTPKKIKPGEILWNYEIYRFS